MKIILWFISLWCIFSSTSTQALITLFFFICFFIWNVPIIKKRTDKLEEALNEYIALQSKGTIFTFRHNNGPSLYDILLNRGKPTKLQNDIIKMIQQDEKFGSQLNKILTYSNTLGEFMTLKNEKETLKSTDNNKKSDKISN